MLASRNGDAVRPALCALRRRHLIENVSEVAVIGTGDLIAPPRNRVERIHYRVARLTIQPREVANFGGRHHGERSSWLAVARAGLHIEPFHPGTSVGTLSLHFMSIRSMRTLARRLGSQSCRTARAVSAEAPGRSAESQ